MTWELRLYWTALVQNNSQLVRNVNPIYSINSLVCYHTNKDGNLIYDCLTCKSSACIELADLKRTPTNANSQVTQRRVDKLSGTSFPVVRTFPAFKFCFVSILISTNLVILPLGRFMRIIEKLSPNSHLSSLSQILFGIPEISRREM